MTEHSRDRLVRGKLANATAAVPLFPGRLAKRIILESRYWPLTVLASHRSFPRSCGAALAWREAGLVAVSRFNATRTPARHAKSFVGTCIELHTLPPLSSNFEKGLTPVPNCHTVV